MSLCSLYLIFFTAGERITFCGAVDRAVDLATSLIFWGAAARGPGPGTQLAPTGPTLNLMGVCPLKLTFFTAGERITFGAAIDRAVDDATVIRILGPGAQGPRAEDPIGP